MSKNKDKSKAKNSGKAKSKRKNKLDGALSKNGASSKTLRLESLLQEVWPTERDFFERPDRYRYVRKMIPHQGCVFCLAEKNEPSFKTLCLAKSKLSMVMLNKYPYNTGHLLILPRRHIGQIWDLTKDEIKDLGLWTQAAMSILDKAYGCNGMNVGMNHGAAAGAGIPDHLHWHIVPRWSGDTNFFPLIAETKALPETLKQSYQRLNLAFKKEMKQWT